MLLPLPSALRGALRLCSSSRVSVSLWSALSYACTSDVQWSSEGSSGGKRRKEGREERPNQPVSWLGYLCMHCPDLWPAPSMLGFCMSVYVSFSTICHCQSCSVSSFLVLSVFWIPYLSFFLLFLHRWASLSSSPCEVLSLFPFASALLFLDLTCSHMLSVLHLPIKPFPLLPIFYCFLSFHSPCILSTFPQAVYPYSVSLLHLFLFLSDFVCILNLWSTHLYMSINISL